MVEIKKVTLNIEEQFIRNCQRNEDYQKFVRRMDNDLYDDYYVFYSYDERIGFCKTNLNSITGIISAKPNIYLTKRLGRTSRECFIALLEMLFFRENVERIAIRIYSGNVMMRKLSRFEFFCFEGVFKEAVLIDGKIEDILFYSINVTDYLTFIKKYAILQ